VPARSSRIEAYAQLTARTQEQAERAATVVEAHRDVRVLETLETRLRERDRANESLHERRQLDDTAARMRTTR
jgi:hypothetical protein